MNHSFKKYIRNVPLSTRSLNPMFFNIFKNPLERFLMILQTWPYRTCHWAKLIVHN
jgi:hypothetical protein